MTEKQKQMLIGGCKTLRENKKKAIGEMRNEDGGRCCLCVLDDYARENSDIEYKEQNKFLPSSSYFEEVYGFSFYFTFFKENSITLSSHNDGTGVDEKSHVEIAELIEEKFNLNK